MNARCFYLMVSWVMFPGSLFAARSLVESTFTQVINDVNVTAPAGKSTKPARVAEIFKSPDLLRTGRESRAEMVAADKTLTRVGANTVFSFEPKGRTIDLEEGSVLFHSPSGKGGGTIRTKAASASVLGTTLIVATTANGGFKALVMEGKGLVRLPNGDYRVLQAGQMVFVLPGATKFGPLLDINLDKLVKGSRLVNGFESQLPSVDRIAQAVARQARLIAAGGAVDTGLLVGNYATQTEVRVVDNTTLERVVQTPLQVALRTDTTIASSILNPVQSFLDPTPAVVLGVDQTVFRGFAGQNITLTSPTVDLSTVTGTGTTEFDILASGTLDIQNSVSFSGNATGAYTFQINSVDGTTIAPGSTLTVNNLGDFELNSGASMSYVNVSFQNLSGGVGIDSSANLSLSGGTASGSFINLQGQNVDLNGTALSAVAVLGPNDIGISAGNNLTVNAGSISGAGSTSSLLMTAGNTLSLNNTALTSLGSLNLEARTLTLQNIDFPAGSIVTLKSALGQLAPFPNTGLLPVTGFVNYVSGVRYGGTLLTASPNPNITIQSLP